MLRGVARKGCGWILEDQGGVQEGGRASLTHLGDFSSCLKYMVVSSLA